MRKLYDKLFPFGFCILLVYFMWEEYRDHGWKGVIVITVAGFVVFAIMEIGVELMVKRERRKHEGQ